MELTIIIPCFNEERRLAKTLKKIASYILSKKYQTELILVNDGSTDRTLEVLNEFFKTNKINILIKTKLINYKKNRGKGYAVKQGILLASKKNLLIFDADSSTPITELEKLNRYINKYDLVIGSRKQRDSTVIVPQSPLREFMGKAYSYISKVLLAVNVNDFTCGFKLLKKYPAKVIASKMVIDRWGYDSEMLKIASLKRFKIKEVGIIWKNDQNTKVRLSRDVLISLFDLFKIYIISQFKRYE